jgi:hypothetical protein
MRDRCRHVSRCFTRDSISHLSLVERTSPSGRAPASRDTGVGVRNRLRSRLREPAFGGRHASDVSRRARP